MPAGPIGSVWASGSWADTAWEAGTWADLPSLAFHPDIFEDHAMSEFWIQYEGVTTSDTVDGPFEFDALYVGAAGNVVVIRSDGVAVTFVGVPASRILPVRGKRVNQTNTTASSLVALKRKIS